eukprot:Clim_evm3s237 gene=Clim_evmTU3s237
MSGEAAPRLPSIGKATQLRASTRPSEATIVSQEFFDAPSRIGSTKSAQVPELSFGRDTHAPHRLAGECITPRDLDNQRVPDPDDGYNDYSEMEISGSQELPVSQVSTKTIEITYPEAHVEDMRAPPATRTERRSRRDRTSTKFKSIFKRATTQASSFLTRSPSIDHSDKENNTGSTVLKLPKKLRAQADHKGSPNQSPRDEQPISPRTRSFEQLNTAESGSLHHQNSNPSLVSSPTRSNTPGTEALARNGLGAIALSGAELHKTASSGSLRGLTLEGYNTYLSPGKKSKDFGQLVCLQSLRNAHQGSIYCMEFSPCGRMLATAGEDGLVKVWVLHAFQEHIAALCELTDDDIDYIRRDVEMYQDDRSSTTFDDWMTNYGSNTSLNGVGGGSVPSSAGTQPGKNSQLNGKLAISLFNRIPLRNYTGHTDQIVTLSWYNSYFLLTGSVDRTVRLWHISRDECLLTFQHPDAIVSVAFDPTDDRLFMSASLDAKLRIWSIESKKVLTWNSVSASDALISKATFCNNGKTVVAGTFDGQLIFFNIEHVRGNSELHMRYHTQISVKSSRGKNKKGHKICGIANANRAGDRLIVTSNDSRIRVYDLKGHKLVCKYKGFASDGNSPLNATVSEDGVYMICPSEDSNVFFWKMSHEACDLSKDAHGKFRRDRNPHFEVFNPRSESPSTVARFMPFSTMKLQVAEEAGNSQNVGLAVANRDGDLTFILNL